MRIHEYSCSVADIHLFLPLHPADAMCFLSGFSPAGKVAIHERMEAGIVAGL